MNKLAMGTLFFAVCHVQATAQSGAYPPPGLYQIDNETTTTAAAGPMVSKSTVATSGIDGSVVVTGSGLMPGDKGVVTRYAGAGPITFCVPKYTPPVFPKRCNSSAAGTCSGMEYSKWTRLSDKVWETSFVQTAAAKGAEQGGADARSALNSRLLANIPAEQRAALQAQLGSLPNQAELRQKDAGLAAQMEKGATNLPPELAQMMRNQAAAMRGSPNAGASSGTRWDIKERWTLLASTCTQK